MKSKNSHLATAILMGGVLILLTGFTRKDIEEEQRIISSSHTDRAVLHIEQAERRIGSGLYNAARVNLLVASYNLDVAKDLMDAHKPKIEQIDFFFPRSDAAEKVRQNYRKKAEELELLIFNNEDIVTALAKDLNNKLKDVGGFWQFDALEYLRYLIDNTTDPVEKARLQAQLDAALEAMDRGNLAETDKNLDEYKGKKVPKSDKPELGESHQQLLDDLANRIEAEDDPVKKAYLRNLYKQVVSHLENGDVESAAVLLDDIFSDGGTHKENLDKISELIEDIQNESNAARKMELEEILKKIGASLQDGATDGVGSALDEAEKLADMDGEIPESSEIRNPSNLTGGSGKATRFIDPVSGEETEFPPDFEWVDNKLGPKISTTYIGGKGNRLTGETEISLVRKPDPSNPDVWLAEKVIGNKVRWDFRLSEVADTRMTEDRIMKTTLQIKDNQGKETFSVQTWEVRDQSGNLILNVSGDQKMIEASFEQSGNFVITVTGKTQWGSSFRIRDQLNVQL